MVTAKINMCQYNFRAGVGVGFADIRAGVVSEHLLVFSLANQFKYLRKSVAVTAVAKQSRKGNREKLLNAALSLIVEDQSGLAGLSLRKITKQT